MTRKIIACLLALGPAMLALGGCAPGLAMRGNGNIVERAFLLFPDDTDERFHLEIAGLNLQGINLRTTIVIDENLERQVFITTDENIAEQISFQHSDDPGGNTIAIRSNRARRLSPTELTITTGLPITSLTVGGSWHIEHNCSRVTDFTARVSGSARGAFNFDELEQLDMTISGSGRVSVQGEANAANLRISGSGRIEAFGLAAQTADLNISGSGRTELYVAEQLNATLSGSGRAAVRGTADAANLRITGSGRVEAFELEAQTAEVTIGGSGRAELNVVEELNARVSGSGRVIYDGNPRISQQTSGSGRITAR